MQHCLSTCPPSCLHARLPTRGLQRGIASSLRSLIASSLRSQRGIASATCWRQIAEHTNTKHWPLWCHWDVMSLIYCLITEPACRCPTQPSPFSLVDVNTRGHLTELVMQNTDGRGGLRSGIRHCFLGMSLARLAENLVRIGWAPRGVRINGPSVALDGEALSGTTVSQRR